MFFLSIVFMVMLVVDGYVGWVMLVVVVSVLMGLDRFLVVSSVCTVRI